MPFCMRDDEKKSGAAPLLWLNGCICKNLNRTQPASPRIQIAWLAAGSHVTSCSFHPDSSGESTRLYEHALPVLPASHLPGVQSGKAPILADSEAPPALRRYQAILAQSYLALHPRREYARKVWPGRTEPGESQA